MLKTCCQLKLEYVGDMQAAVLRCIFNPRAGWEADGRDRSSVVESLTRQENYQNILNQAPSNVFASCQAVVCVSMRRLYASATGFLVAFRRCPWCRVLRPGRWTTLKESLFGEGFDGVCGGMLSRVTRKSNSGSATRHDISANAAEK